MNGGQLLLRVGAACLVDDPFPPHTPAAAATLFYLLSPTGVAGLHRLGGELASLLRLRLGHPAAPLPAAALFYLLPPAGVAGLYRLGGELAGLLRLPLRLGHPAAPLPATFLSATGYRVPLGKRHVTALDKTWNNFELNSYSRIRSIILITKRSTRLSFKGAFHWRSHKNFFFWGGGGGYRGDRIRTVEVDH